MSSALPELKRKVNRPGLATVSRASRDVIAVST